MKKINPQHHAPRDKVLHAIVCTGLVLFVLGLYAQTFDHTFLNFDDNDYVTDNPFVRQGLTAQSLTWAFTSTLHDHWHPVTWISHMLDVHLFGMDPGSHHFVNVALHALAALMLFLSMQRMTGAYWLSLGVAMLFAVHPMNVQSVAWIAERKNVLSTFLAFSCLLLYARYASAKTLWRYAACISVFILGMLAKSMLVTLPVLMLILDWWPLRRLTRADRIDPKAVFAALLEKIPFLAIALAIGLAMLFIHAGRVEHADFVARSLGERAMIAIQAYAFYLHKLVWPTNLSIIYPSDAPVSTGSVITSATVLLAITAAATLSWRKYPFFAAGWAWYLVSLLPVSGLVQTGPVGLADRFVYIPYVGLFVSIVWGIDAAVTKAKSLARHAVIAFAIAIIVLATITWRNIALWKDDRTVFSHAQAVTQDNYKALVNLGLHYMDAGQKQKALTNFHEALAIKPNDKHALYNLGLYHAREKDFIRACSYFQQALASDESNIRPRINLGACLAELGKLEEARSELEKVLELSQQYPKAYYNLGLVWEKLNNPLMAKTHYAKALELDPSYRLAQDRLNALP